MQTIPPPLKKNVSGWPWEPSDIVVERAKTCPKISMMVPSFQRGDYIEETIRSILMQDYPNLELIVMDGGSTDGTVTVLQHYDAHITYWESKRDKGQSDGLNKGLPHCTGDIVTFQNSDDIYLPGVFHAVARMYNDNPGAGVFAGGFYHMGPDSKRVGEDIPAFINVDTPADLTLGPAECYRIHQNAVFFSSAAVDDVGRYVRDDLDFTMDRELLYRIVKKYPVVLTEQTFGAFRKHPDSKSTHSIRPFATEWARLHREYKNGDPGEDSRREDMARFRLYRGEVQYAKFVENKREQMFALWNAVKYRPRAVLTRSYIRLLVKVLFNKIEQV